MNKILMKDIQRMIGATKGRFFSLTAIVTIGVAFFVGVSSSSSVMATSVDQYNDQQNLKDITIYSNYGFDQEDLDAVKKMTNVSEAELTKFVDVNAAADTRSMVVRVHAYKEDATINQFVLESGRLPENENECLAENSTGLKTGFALGSTITFSRPENDLSDYLNVKTCKVVGTIDSPLYLDVAKENSTLSNQYINTYIYLPDEAFAMDYDTELNVLLTNAKAYNSFSDEYEAYAKEAKETIEEESLTQKEHRHDVVVADAQKKYDDGLQEYQTSLDEYNQKISDGQQEIDDNLAEITSGEQTLLAAKQTLNDSQAQLDTSSAEAQQKLTDAKTKLDQSSAELAQKKKDFETQKTTLNQNIKDIDDGITSLNTAEDGIKKLEGLQQVLAASSTVQNMLQKYLGVIGNNVPFTTLINMIQNNTTMSDAEKQQTITLLSSSKSALEYVFSTTQKPVTITTVDEMNQYLTTYLQNETVYQKNIADQITSAYTTLNQKLQLTGTGKEISSTNGIEAYVTELDAKKKEINDGITAAEKQLTDAQTQINQGYAELDANTAAFQSSTSDAQAKIDAGLKELQTKENELADGRQQIEDAQNELDQAITDGTQQLEDAKSKLNTAKQDIENLQSGTWTVLDRTQHYSSAAYKNTIHQMKAIAAVFPVFFILVAALVCLTTMTRMVDEQRGQIGVMRALGYSQKQCAEKYMMYACIATIIGACVGCVAGMLIFPGIIYNAWKMMYVLPQMDLALDWPLMIGSALAFVGVMLLTTWYACHEDMKEVPSQLMRPKAPKLEHSTIIEKLPALWNRFSFTWKVTIRNLIRYKKRFYMSVFGVAGCTALMITGFGIRDSIQTIATKQFEEIYRYDGTVTFNKDLSATEVAEQYQSYSKNANVAASTLLTAYSTKVVASDQDDETAYMQIFNNTEDINVMYELQTRVGQKALSLSDDGVIINEKLAENLNKNVGDTITVESIDGMDAEVKISGICEMYVRHYVFMTKSYYQSVFGTTPASNTMAVKLQGTDAEKQALQEEFASQENISSVEFFGTLLDNFNQMINGLDIIVLVLILSSASLAGVVLGNLTNVNISERMREIATLKVLGFRRKEVENYIYKENNILTFIGSLVGIPLGILLHHYIMHEVEMDYIMFGRNITVLSCIVCVGITLIFGILVNLFMAKHLRRIQMVESLKSVE